MVATIFTVITRAPSGSAKLAPFIMTPNNDYSRKLLADALGDPALAEIEKVRHGLLIDTDRIRNAKVDANFDTVNGCGLAVRTVDAVAALQSLVTEADGRGDQVEIFAHLG